jgi:hypothetical protein
LSDKIAAISAALRDQRFRAAFVVIPNSQPAAAYVPEKLQIVPVADLGRPLREITDETPAGPGGEPNAQEASHDPALPGG